MVPAVSLAVVLNFSTLPLIQTHPFTINIDSLNPVLPKEIGTREGGIYEDSNGTKWYLKSAEDRNLNEFFTSRILQFLVPLNTAPVCFVEGKPGWVASREIEGFRSQIDVVSRGKDIQDELKLLIALDFVRYIDRIRGNLGYIVDDENPRLLTAACVDYDLGFRFFWSEDYRTIWFSLTQLEQLTQAIEIFESYTKISKDEMLHYVDSLIREAEKNKGLKCKLDFDLSDFPQMISTRLNKMREAMLDAKALDAYIKSPSIIDGPTLEIYNGYTKYLFKDSPTLIQLAFKGGNTHLVDLLLKSGATLQIPTETTDTKPAQTSEDLESLLANGGDINAYDEHHTTPLHRAIERDESAMALRLLKAGALPNKMVFERPIHLAIKKDNPVLARELSSSYPYKKWTLVDKALECRATKVIQELAPLWLQESNHVQKQYLEEMSLK